MINFLKDFYEFVARRLMGFGGDVPVTEDIQNSILRLLQDHGQISAFDVVSLLYNNHPQDRMIREVLQAAQILVNQGQIRAFTEKVEMDPVYGNEMTEFKLLL